MSDRQALIDWLRHWKHEVPTTREREEMIEAMRDAATALEEAQGVPREPDEPDGWLVTDPINPSQVFSERPPDTERGCLIPLYAWDRIEAAYAAPAAPTREPVSAPPDEQDAKRWRAVDQMMREGGVIDVNAGGWQLFVASIDADLAEPKR